MLEINQDNFKKEVTASEKPVIIDFWAPWCMPCKMIAPMVETISKEHNGKVSVGKVNVDENPELATDLSVMNIPTLIFFKNGKEAGRVVGVNKKEYIEAKIKEYFS